MSEVKYCRDCRNCKRKGVGKSLRIRCSAGKWANFKGIEKTYRTLDVIMKPKMRFKNRFKDCKFYIGMGDEKK